MHDYRVGMAATDNIRSIRLLLVKRIHGAVITLVVLASFAGPTQVAESQALPYTEDASNTLVSVSPVQFDPAYLRPTQRTKFRNFVFDAFGPYPVVGSGIVAGINQFSNAPPEWNQGAEGFGKRFGSDFGIAMVSTTTRYGLSEAFKEDALYYRCDCQGTLQRLSHAVTSTLTARRGEDGHRVFSIPALVSPYAGSMTAVYGWYPSRYNAKDAFRTGNYSLLVYMSGNFALEFFYSGPHSLLHRMHLNNAHGSSVEGPNK
jgi:hypothetical protein